MTVTVEKIVLATNNSGFNSIEFNVFAYKSKERRERERRERLRGRRASEEDRRREVSLLHLENCLLIAESDIVFYHPTMF